ncbi:MAG: RNase adapter RapZ [Woeseiaceae bacterium]
MRLVIIGGLSGSGKSIALHVLEDIGFFCIDNLPIALLPALADELKSEKDSRGDKIAIGIDPRNRQTDLVDLKERVEKLRDQGTSCDIVFLKTDDNTLLKRYSETRRKHPLAEDDLSLRDAIASERAKLLPVLNLADLIIDTTRTSVYELRDIIRSRVGSKAPHQLSILIESFGYKHGIPRDADFVFDLRCLPNPYWEPSLRAQTGLDAPVTAFLRAETMVHEMEKSIRDFLDQWIPNIENFSRNYLTIALGCTGGQHRSVYMAEQIAAHLRTKRGNVTVRHDELISKTSPLFP